MLGLQRKSHTNSASKIKLGRHVNDKKSIRLFQNIIYLIDDALSDQQQNNLVNLLNNNGGLPAGNDKKANLYVSQSKPYVLDESVTSVTPLWVEKAIANGFVHETHYYIPGKNQFLSGEVLLLLDLPDDSAVIFEQIEKFGGQYRDDITDDLTCLVCIEPRGVQYNACKDQDIPAVLPQWLDDCLRYHCRLKYERYRFPSPSIYYQHNPHQPTLHPYPTDMKIVSTFLPSPQNIESEFGPSSPKAHLFKNEIIYIGKDVMSDHRKTPLIPIIINYIKRAGGHVLSEYNRHLVTIVILKYRSSLEYRQALQDGKWVASFWWLSNTLARGYLCDPRSTLLDYPVPKVGIPEMRHCIIAVTGFKGAARSFINVLIVAAGAKFSAEIQADTTHLICGGGYGNKYAQLFKYPHVIKVNHLWLEDCYTHWKMLDHTKDPRYTYIPDDNSLLADTVGKTSLLQHVLDHWKHDTIEAEPKVIYEEYQQENVSNNDDGFVRERKPRKAALRALSVLNDIVIPDVNAYEKELKQKR
ncbi:hypothetical protein BDF20DRAFT_864853 [Mycotypha africana]|uniref:uncharacterized protein n=1 Tax=Mycotypha africana TaxID=64632 RepID=UPI0023008EAE|nr:uncharacterized protein BDF20DRAFT_864853 [Mycotypha africana]KAI8982078.1 hypothetical protein BDF20DRAFT_864853 [Mycotypha africana]